MLTLRFCRSVWSKEVSLCPSLLSSRYWIKGQSGPWVTDVPFMDQSRSVGAPRRWKTLAEKQKINWRNTEVQPELYEGLVWQRISNTCNNIDKSMQKLWQIHVSTLKYPCNNLENSRANFNLVSTRSSDSELVIEQLKWVDYVRTWVQ